MKLNFLSITLLLEVFDRREAEAHAKGMPAWGKCSSKFFYAKDRTREVLIRAIRANKSFVELCLWLQTHKLADPTLKDTEVKEIPKDEKPESKEEAVPVGEAKEEKIEINDTRIVSTQEEWDTKQQEYNKLLNEQVDIDIYYCLVDNLPLLDEHEERIMRNCGFIKYEEEEKH